MHRSPAKCKLNITGSRLTASSSQFFCKSVTTSDLRQVLQPLASWSGSKFKSFDFTGDIDYRAALTTLSANDFANITFESITIRLTRLSAVDEQAFGANANVTWKLSLPYNLLTERVFEVTSTFRRLQVLRLPYNRIQRISAAAFASNQRELYKIDLSFNHISAIGNGAFSHLANLEQVDLNNNKVAVIGSQVFAPMPGLRVSNQTLSANLEVNELTSRSFRNDSLTGRRLRLNLAVNMIGEMTESVFGPVFAAGGSVDMQRNPITCDCTLPSYLRLVPSSACSNCRCANGSSIFALTPVGTECATVSSPAPCPGSRGERSAVA